MELTRWDPSTLMNGLLEDVWSPLALRQSTRPFEADVVELGEEIRVTAELPGVKRDDLDLTLENNVLTISGEKKDRRANDNEGTRHHLMERCNNRKRPPQI